MDLATERSRGNCTFDCDEFVSEFVVVEADDGVLQPARVRRDRVAFEERQQVLNLLTGPRDCQTRVEHPPALLDGLCPVHGLREEVVVRTNICGGKEKEGTLQKKKIYPSLTRC